MIVFDTRTIQIFVWDYPKIISEKWNLAVNSTAKGKEQKSSPGEALASKMGRGVPLGFKT